MDERVGAVITGSGDVAACYLGLEELQGGAPEWSCREELDERKKHLGDGKDFQNWSSRPELSESSRTHFLSHSQPGIWLKRPTRQRQAPR